MAPPKTPPAVIDAIKTLWAQDPDQTAVAVWEQYKRTGSHKISKRKVQLIIAEAKKDATGRLYPLVEWHPWRNEIESRDDARHLLRLDAISMARSGRHLYQNEAKWGRRLRTATDGLNLWQQYNITRLYALRERAAYYLGEPRAYTADLDGILAYRPWLPENEEAYNNAVSAGAVPYPTSFGPSDMQEHHDATEELTFPGHDLDAYRRRTSYWKVAKRMFDQLPRRAQHIDRTNDESFIAWTLDGVLDFWAGEQPHESQGSNNPFEGADDER